MSRRAARTWIAVAALVGNLAVAPGTAAAAESSPKAPTVTSTVYRENGGPPGDGGEGIPGDFTFSADGDEDVVEFEYFGIGIRGGRVAADQPGGSATITVTPSTDGPVHIEVAGIGPGGRSPARYYRYWVRATAPWVDAPQFELGVPGEVEFTAIQDGAQTFVYRLDDGAEQLLPIGPDRKARKTFTFTEPGNAFHEIIAWTLDATGFKSGISDRPFYVDQVEPWVSVDAWSGLVGQKRTFTVVPERDNVVSYVYRIGADPEVSLPAAPDGSLTFEYTPGAAGWFDVRVASINGAGIRSGWGESRIEAEAPGPVVASTDYVQYVESGGPGITGTFTFTAPRLPAVSYRYIFDNEPEQTVAAGPDGSASIQWTPATPEFHYLYVRSVTATGVVTDETRYYIRVRPLAPTVTSPQFPENAPPTAKVGEPVEFIVTPNLPGSHEVIWQVGSTSQVVPVGPDGTATFTFTPGGGFELTVSTRTPAGFLSGKTTRTYHPRS